MKFVEFLIRSAKIARNIPRRQLPKNRQSEWIHRHPHRVKVPRHLSRDISWIPIFSGIYRDLSSINVCQKTWHISKRLSRQVGPGQPPPSGPGVTSQHASAVRDDLWAGGARLAWPAALRGATGVARCPPGRDWLGPLPFGARLAWPAAL